LANGKMMMMLKPCHASEFFLHRLFVQPFSLFSLFFLPFTSVFFFSNLNDSMSLCFVTTLTSHCFLW